MEGRHKIEARRPRHARKKTETDEQERPWTSDTAPSPPGRDQASKPWTEKEEQIFRPLVAVVSPSPGGRAKKKDKDLDISWGLLAATVHDLVLWEGKPRRKASGQAEKVVEAAKKGRKQVAASEEAPMDGMDGLDETRRENGAGAIFPHPQGCLVARCEL